MPRLLVINPNTSTAISSLLQRHVQVGVGDAFKVHTVTARFGSSSPLRFLLVAIVLSTDYSLTRLYKHLGNGTASIPYN